VGSVNPLQSKQHFTGNLLQTQMFKMFLDKFESFLQVGKYQITSYKVTQTSLECHLNLLAALQIQ
jgi:hypothetical protein